MMGEERWESAGRGREAKEIPGHGAQSPSLSTHHRLLPQAEEAEEAVTLRLLRRLAASEPPSSTGPLRSDAPRCVAAADRAALVARAAAAEAAARDAAAARVALEACLEAEEERVVNRLHRRLAGLAAELSARRASSATPAAPPPPPQVRTPPPRSLRAVPDLMDAFDSEGGGGGGSGGGESLLGARPLWRPVVTVRREQRG